MYSASPPVSIDFKQIRVDKTYAEIGDEILFYVTNLVDEGPFYYSITGTLSQTGFVDGQSTGYIELQDGKLGKGYAIVSKTLSSNAHDGQVFTFELRSVDPSGPILLKSPEITVTDNLKPQILGSVTPSTLSVTNGDSVKFLVECAGLSDGNYFWSTVGTLSASAFSDNLTTGTFSLTSSTGQITRFIATSTVIDSTDFFSIAISKKYDKISYITSSPYVAVSSVTTGTVATNTNSVTLLVLEKISNNLERISNNLEKITTLANSNGIRTTSPYDWAKPVEIYSWYNQDLETLVASQASVVDLITTLGTATTYLPKFI